MAMFMPRDSIALPVPFYFMIMFDEHAETLSSVQWVHVAFIKQNLQLKVTKLILERK